MSPALLDAERATALDRDGYLVLRSAIPPKTLAAARDAFDAGVLPSDQWPVPRGRDWRHALVDHDPAIREICRLPDLVAAAHQLIGGPFFLTQVEGREPKPGGGAQPLHRDGLGDGPVRVVAAMAYLDDYGPANGATRVLAGSHKHRVWPLTQADDAAATVAEGRAGDILVFDADLGHGGTLNASGARRRSLLITYFAASLMADHKATAAQRNVTMDPVEMFYPAALAPSGA